ncbi:hypothetical protein [Engelhardtia mirabilis]
MAEGLTVEQINWFIGAAIAGGRAPSSVAGHDLELLRAAAKTAQIAWPEETRTIRESAPKMPFFEPDELLELIRRAKAEGLRGLGGAAHCPRVSSHWT